MGDVVDVGVGCLVEDVFCFGVDWDDFCFGLYEVL